VPLRTLYKALNGAGCLFAAAADNRHNRLETCLRIAKSRYQ